MEKSAWRSIEFFVKSIFLLGLKTKRRRFLKSIPAAKPRIKQSSLINNLAALELSKIARLLFSFKNFWSVSQLVTINSIKQTFVL
jgi:hypothetical protein